MSHTPTVRAENKKLNLQLIITEQCNLRCKYCFEIDKKPRSMPVELAREIIDRVISTHAYKEYQIDLVGGEPFLNFKDVKEIVEYGKNYPIPDDKKIYFYIGTNLTLLDEEIKKWLAENKGRVVLGTSLDGTRTSHDHYRCESYDAVVRHIPFYKSLYPLQGAKMTLGPDTIGSLYEGVLNIESIGLGVAVNVVFEPVWGDIESKRRHLKKYAEQLSLLVNHYAEDPLLAVPNILSLPINHLLIRPQNADYRWCGSGRQMKAFDVDGRELPCHRFARFSTNMTYDGPAEKKPGIKTKCDGCAYLMTCPTCYGYNWQVNGDPDTRTSYHCEFIKLQLLAAAKLIFLRNRDLIDKLAEGEEEEIREIPINTLKDIKAAHYIMHDLNEEKIIVDCEIGYP
jgi:uncharacterized protein